MTTGDGTPVPPRKAIPEPPVAPTVPTQPAGPAATAAPATTVVPEKKAATVASVPPALSPATAPDP